MRAVFSLVLSAFMAISCSQDPDRMQPFAIMVNGAQTIDRMGARDLSDTPVLNESYGTLTAGRGSLSAGEHHSCVVWDGAVHCWGYGLAGQLGQGDFQNQAVPLAVKNLGHDNIAVATGDLHSCAIKTSGEIYCWGFNQTGAIGNGRSGREYAFSGQARANNVTQAERVQGLEGIPMVQAVATKTTTCALAQSGDVYCWGSGSNYELGDGEMENSQNRFNHHTGVARKVTVLSEKARSLHAGERAFCAVTESSRVICWGRLSLPMEKNHPVLDLSSSERPVSLAMADQHACIVDEAHQLHCIGDNWYQQNGLPGIANAWTKVNGELFTHIATARKTTCGITPGGRVRCWGVCLYGLCGTQFAARLVSPTQAQNVYAYSTQKSIEIEGIHDATEIAVGARHACALLAHGEVRCWGSGFLGELGHGKSESSAEPQIVNF